MTPDTRRIETIHAVRAFGIAMVVANHAMGSLSLHGGLTLLLIVSGISFAQLGFRDTTAQTMRAALGFLKTLVLGSMALCLVWFALRGRVDPLEIAMVANWISVDRISLFPIWYAQALLQLMAILMLAFWALDLTPKLKARPLAVTGAILAAFTAAALVSKATWYSLDLQDKLPHLIGWLFVLGWVYWALLVARPATPLARLVFSVLAVGLFYGLVKGAGIQAAMPRAAIVLGPLLLLVWVPSLNLPRAVTHAIFVVSQATLYLFFFHYPFILVAWDLADALELGRAGGALLRSGAGFLGPILLWALVTATRRVLVAEGVLDPRRLRMAEPVRALRPALRRRLSGAQRT